MQPAAALRRAFQPDRRWTTLAQGLTCALCLLIVCHQYQQTQQRQLLQQVQQVPSAAMASSDSMMMGLPQGPKHACVSDDWMEYRECIEATAGHAGATFGDYLHKTFGSDAADAQPARPWAHPPASGVIVEFRPLEQLLKFTISNAMDNLPVAWCFYVAGNRAVRGVVEEHFGAEVAVGKIRFINMEHADIPQSRISQILSAKTLYDQMEGDYWFFFQTGSAICKAQRHLIKPVLEKGYGWWGAPWPSHIIVMTPYNCGNSGFSLRKREMMMPLLEQNPAGTGSSEDGYFCGMAGGLIHSGRTRSPPAPYYDELQFSVETMMHTKPFAVHAPWKDFMPSWEVRALVENCSELIHIMPERECVKFGKVLCGANVDRSQFVMNETMACNWDAMCGAPIEDKFRVFTESLGYAVA